MVSWSQFIRMARSQELRILGILICKWDPSIGIKICTWRILRILQFLVPKIRQVLKDPKNWSIPRYAISIRASPMGAREMRLSKAIWRPPRVVQASGWWGAGQAPQQLTHHVVSRPILAATVATWGGHCPMSGVATEIWNQKLIKLGPWRVIKNLIRCH